MMSPIALRGKTSRLSNRGVPAVRESVTRTAIRNPSRFSRPQPRARTNDLGGRVILGITHDHDSASTGFQLVALGDALRRVVGSLGMKSGPDFAEDGPHVLF